LLYSQDKIIGVWLGEAAINHREENPFFYHLLTVLNISDNNMATVSNRQNLTYFTWSAVKDYFQFKHDSLQTPLKAKIINHKLIVTLDDYSDFVFIKIKNTFKDKDSEFQEIIPFKFLTNGGLKLLKDIKPLNGREIYKSILYLKRVSHPPFF